jgi:hypothetical protein
MIKSRRMRWAGHVAGMGRRGMQLGYWWDIYIGMKAGRKDTIGKTKT